MKSLTELNTFSAESVAYDDQGTGAATLANRYQINGLIDTNQTVMSNIEKICSAAGSWLSYDITTGKWGVVINNTGTSTASFDDTNILGNIGISGTGISELYNAVKAEFPHRELRDSADFVTIEIADADRNANEEDNTLNLSYDIINEPIQAQMLGLIELKQSRIDLVINFQTDYSNIAVKAGDIIDVTNSRFGFAAKLFRVISTTEQQDEEGALRIEITALEYDADVYSIADLYRYTRSDSTGIITIGSIGIPGTPQITKFENSSRPRIVVETTAPTGVVEAVEYWLTEDTVETEDSLRSYKLIASIKPPGGGTYTSGNAIILDYDSLPEGDFYIKTRGVNGATTGPFSNISGLIEYVPQQITDAIGPDTAVVDATGAILTALAANYLMNQLSDLIQGNVADGGIFKTITDKIEELTGIDLSGETGSGLVATSQLAVKDEGTQVTSSATNINFVGAFDVTADAGNVTVTLNIPAGSASVANGNEFGDFLKWNGSAWVPVSLGVSGGGATITSTLPYQTPTALPSDKLSVTGTYPPDRATFNDSVAANIELQDSDYASTTGNYLIYFNAGRGSLDAGSGNAKLYKNDGTLVDTVAIGSCTIDLSMVRIPFTTRDFGTDYFVTVDEGFVSYCGKPSRAVNPPKFNTLTTLISYDRDATVWNFNTPLFSVDPYTDGPPVFDPPEEPALSGVGLVSYFYKSEQVSYIESVNPTTGVLNQPPLEKTKTVLTRVDDYATVIANNESLRLAGYGTVPGAIPSLLTVDQACPNAYITISFNYFDTVLTGNLYIKDADGNTVRTLDVTDGVINGGNTLIFPRGSLTAGVTYHIEHDAGILSNRENYPCDGDYETVISAYTGTGKSFTIEDPVTLPDFGISSDPLAIEDTTLVNPQSEITLNFNRAVRFRSAGYIRIYKADGTLHQEINIADLYSNEYINELVWWSGTGIPSNLIELSTTPQIKDTGSTLTINPTRDMSIGETYYVQVTSGTIEDGCRSVWAGISDTTTVRFSIDPGPTATTAPVTDESVYIEMTFDREVIPGTGNINYSAGGTPVGSTDANDSSVEITTA